MLAPTPLILSLSKDEPPPLLVVRQAHHERRQAHRERRVKRMFGPILASRWEGGQNEANSLPRAVDDPALTDIG